MTGRWRVQWFASKITAYSVCSRLSFKDYKGGLKLAVHASVPRSVFSRTVYEPWSTMQNGPEEGLAWRSEQLIGGRLLGHATVARMILPVVIVAFQDHSPASRACARGTAHAAPQGVLFGYACVSRYWRIGRPTRTVASCKNDMTSPVSRPT